MTESQPWIQRNKLGRFAKNKRQIPDLPRKDDEGHIICTLCNKTFASVWSLERHMKSFHPIGLQTGQSGYSHHDAIFAKKREDRETAKSVRPVDYRHGVENGCLMYVDRISRESKKLDDARTLPELKFRDDYRDTPSKSPEKTPARASPFKLPSPFRMPSPSRVPVAEARPFYVIREQRELERVNRIEKERSARGVDPDKLAELKAKSDEVTKQWEERQRIEQEKRDKELKEQEQQRIALEREENLQREKEQKEREIERQRLATEKEKAAAAKAALDAAEVSNSRALRSWDPANIAARERQSEKDAADEKARKEKADKLEEQMKKKMEPYVREKEKRDAFNSERKKEYDHAASLFPAKTYASSEGNLLSNNVFREVVRSSHEIGVLPQVRDPNTSVLEQQREEKRKLDERKAKERREAAAKQADQEARDRDRVEQQRRRTEERLEQLRREEEERDRKKAEEFKKQREADKKKQEEEEREKQRLDTVYDDNRSETETWTVDDLLK